MKNIKIKKIKELCKQLNEANDAYYNQNREIFSNRQYDALMDELRELETQTGVILSDSPSARVGAEAVSKLEKRTHSSVALSLDKTKSIETLKEFLQVSPQGILSYKLDGLTIILAYENGKLKMAVTRGNGLIGEDVTHNARLFANLPLNVPYFEPFIVRGEAVISYKEFERINSNENGVYKNPRNLCAGTVRQLDSSILKEREVCFFPFYADLPAVSKSARLNYLKELGFEVVEYAQVNISTVERETQLLSESAKNYDFPLDGLVLEYDDIEFSVSLGASSKYPKDALAFKWQDEVFETLLIDVEWSTSRGGLINPVAVFEPVEIEGTIVERASLHNVSVFLDLKLGKGDTVSVYKANMIIPQLEDNLTRSGGLEIPEFCPVCGVKTHILSVNEAKTLHCPNESCPAQIKGRFVHFVSRDAMNIEGLSGETLEKFYKAGFIKNFADLFKLERYELEIINMRGFGRRAYENIIKSANDARKIKLANFINALGIKHMGLANAKLLETRFNDIEEIIKADYESLLEIKGFGEAIARSVLDYFRNSENLNALNELRENLEIIPEEAPTGVLAGKTFAITGKLTEFANRAALVHHIETRGGKAVSSVSKSVDYLINNDLNSKSGKNKTALALNIPIINEEQYINLT